MACAARYSQKHFKANKVVIFDWDVHVGEGTAQIFMDDPTVLYVSIHRYDQGKFFPGNGYGSHDKIGAGAGAGFNIQWPFDVDKNSEIGDYDYIYACKTVLFPIIKEFEPDLILISAGFDCAKGDPLGGVFVNPVGFAYMTWGLKLLCKKVVVALEGGYDLTALEQCAEAVIKTLQINPNNKAGFDKLFDQLA